MLACSRLGFKCRQAWAADAHDARPLGLQRRGPGQLMLMMLAHLVLNAKDLGG